MNFNLLPPVVLRLIGVALILALGWGVYVLINDRLLKKVPQDAKPLNALPRGKPTLLYFTTPDCIPCKTMQRPAIQHLRATLGEEVHILEIDAIAEPQLANQWRVLSVPTTFIIDAHGKPRFVNRGVASTEKLLHQILKIAGDKNHAKHPHS